MVAHWDNERLARCGYAREGRAPSRSFGEAALMPLHLVGPAHQAVHAGLIQFAYKMHTFLLQSFDSLRGYADMGNVIRYRRQGKEYTKP